MNREHIEGPVGVLRLTRFSMCLIVTAAYVVTAAGSVIPIDSLTLVLTAMGLASLCAYGFTLNDYLDREIDSTYKPERPIPHGDVGLASVHTIIGFLAAVGVGMPWLVSWQSGLLALAVLALATSYSHMKRRWLLPTMLVTPLMCTSPFLFAWLQTKEIILIFFASVVFVLVFGREQIKDIQDAEGDAIEKLKTFPTTFGIGTALALCGVLFGVVLGALPLSYVFGLDRLVGIPYVVFTIGGVGLTLLLALGLVFFSRGRRSLHYALVITKYGIASGILGIALDKF